MAKRKSDIVAMICKDCKSMNYVTRRNKTNMEEKLALNKFCNKCRKKTTHRESAKLK